jgi:hypothetical protein
LGETEKHKPPVEVKAMKQEMALRKNKDRSRMASVLTFFSLAAESDGEKHNRILDKILSE